jgi:hypothetical protein
MYMFCGFGMLVLPPLLGLYMWRRGREAAEFRPLVACLCLGAVITLLSLKFGGKSLWHSVYVAVPGAGAIRSVGRITLMQQVPLYLVIALGFTYLSRRFGRWALAATTALALFCYGEGLATWTSVYSKAEHRRRLAEVVQTLRTANTQHPCATFYLSKEGRLADVNIDAMWASLVTGIPTANGYSSSPPQGYREAGLYEPAKASLGAVVAWYAAVGEPLAANDICFLKL